MIERLVSRYLLVWLTGLSLLAFFWPEIFTFLRLETLTTHDPFAASRPFLKYLFAVTMFAVGSLMSSEEIREVFHRWPSVFSGTAVQFSVMPLLAYAASRIFPLDEDLRLGLIIVGCVPGAMASNVLTLLARGNVSYSVSLTTAATMISPVVVPLALYLATGHTGIDRVTLAKNAVMEICTLVVGPVVAGHLLARWIAPVGRFLKAYGSTIANLSILWLIATILNGNRSTLLPSETSLPAAIMLLLMAVLAIINLLGYLGGYAGGALLRLPEPKRRALTIEVGMQNAGLGSVLALQLFKDHPAVSLPSVLYMFGCMLSGTLLAQIWSRRPTGVEIAEHQEETEPLI